MSALLNTIPDAQDIFGLLRRWSPVALTGKDAGYKSAVADPGRPNIVTDEGTEDVESVALDLADPTGRAHAAWWVRAKSTESSAFWATITGEEWYLVSLVEANARLNPTQIDLLARLVLRLAGRTP